MMQQNQQMQSQSSKGRAQPQKKKPDTSLILRAICFGIIFLALLIFGIVLIANSASSLAIMLTAFFAVITAILTLMQVAPIIFPKATDPQTVINFYPSSGSVGGSTSHTPHTSTTVFHYNTPLPDKNEFYGRELQRETLLDRTRKGASTAIDGERRIGKTWLMRYLQLIAPEHAQLGAKYRVGYVSATSAECKTVNGFVLRAIEVLKAPNTETDPQHVKLETLSKAIHDADNVVNQVIESWKAYFKDLWIRTDEEQRTCLKALIQLECANLQQLQQRTMLEEKVVRRTLQALVKRDLVRQEKDGKYVMAVPMFTRWVKEYGE